MSKFTPLSDELHEYIVAHGTRQDDVLRQIQETAAMGDISVMQIAPDQRLTAMLCRMLGAREAIELGTFTGYSAILHRARARVGRAADRLRALRGVRGDRGAQLRGRGVADRIEIRIGPAAETLRDLPERELFDFAFIDADKTGYPDYYEQVLARTRPAGLIMVDNVLAAGQVLEDGEDFDEFARDSVGAIRRVKSITADERVETVMLGVADGVMLARKR